MAQASFICLLFSFSILFLSIAADISIDCGSSSSHTDAENRKWVGDTTFVTTGSFSKIEADRVTDDLTTLRYFPSGDNNCYDNIPVNKGKKILVRTRFYYGDYDGENKPPRFDVVYDEKHRDSIITKSSSRKVPYSEVIFVTEKGSISVCFVRTVSSEHPFVSTIEVRSLETYMYSDLGSKEGYILQRRAAFGREELVRSPFDPYDRFWDVSSKASAKVQTSAAVSINTTGSGNLPPQIVLRTSLTKKDLTFYDLELPSIGAPFYLIMYFSEPASLSSDQKRSFNVYYDNKQVGSSPVEAPFGAMTYAIMRNVMESKRPRLVFMATPDSTLPPFINALELYVISNTDGREGKGGKGTKSTDDEDESGNKDRHAGSGNKLAGYGVTTAILSLVSTIFF